MQKNYRIWHPFTQHKDAPPPIKVIKGKGSKLTLEGGKEVIDAISSWWVNIHGHCHPKIVQAIQAQSEKLEHVIFADFTHEPAEQLTELVLNLLPRPLNNLFFSDNGSTAVEIALKMAYQYHYNLGKPKTKFMSFKGAYHGDTVGAMSVGDRSLFTLPFLNLLFESLLFPYPPPEQEESVLKAIQTTLEKEGDQIAALIIEPLVQGVAGMKMTTESFLQKLASLLKKANVLLIYDEVMTGFGRVGDFFACSRSNTIPDLICLAKGLTGGFLPLALTVLSDDIYEAFLSSDLKKTFYHGHSYTANPLGCSAAVASMELLVEHKDLFMQMEPKHLSRMKQLSENPHLTNARVKGTIAAIDIQNTPHLITYSQASSHLRSTLLNAGVLIRPLGPVIYLMPPYCITNEELDQIYHAILSVFS